MPGHQPHRARSLSYGAEWKFRPAGPVGAPGQTPPSLDTSAISGQPGGPVWGMLCGGGEGAGAGQGPPAGILPWGDDTPSDAPQRRDVRPLPRGQWGRPDRQCWGRLPGCGSCACAQRRGARGWRQDAGHWLVSGCSARAVLLNRLLIYVQGSVFKGWSSALR